MAVTIQVRPKKTKNSFYPESDGKPMAERQICISDRWINLLVYYEKATPDVRAPDCLSSSVWNSGVGVSIRFGRRDAGRMW